MTCSYACVLTCLVCYRASTLACLLAWCTYMLGVSPCTRGWRVHVLTCYVFSMLACFVFLRAHMFYMLAVLKYLTCLRACVLLWHPLSYFLYIWKVNFQKSLYRKISFYSEKYLEPTWNLWRGFLRKRIKDWKPFTIFAKSVKNIDFSTISTFLFPNYK